MGDPLCRKAVFSPRARLGWRPPRWAHVSQGMAHLDSAGLRCPRAGLASSQGMAHFGQRRAQVSPRWAHVSQGMARFGQRWATSPCTGRPRTALGDLGPHRRPSPCPGPPSPSSSRASPSRRRRAHSCITIPAATATGSEWFTPYRGIPSTSSARSDDLLRHPEALAAEDEDHPLAGTPPPRTGSAGRAPSRAPRPAAPPCAEERLGVRHPHDPLVLLHPHRRLRVPVPLADHDDLPRQEAVRDPDDRPDREGVSRRLERDREVVRTVPAPADGLAVLGRRRNRHRPRGASLRRQQSVPAPLTEGGPASKVRLPRGLGFAEVCRSIRGN